MEQKENNRYLVELKKFENSNVIVQNWNSKGELVETKGRLLGMNYAYGSCIIMTDNHKVLIRNPYRIIRARENPTKQKVEQ